MRPTAAQLLRDLTGPGHRRALGRAITLLESTVEDDRATADELIDLIRRDSRPHTFRVGVSGTPGVGKSTFIERFGLDLIAAGHRVAVLAVDPSSGVSGGSILGDKTRMEELSRREEAFIRPSPNVHESGGVSQGTRAAVLLCEAAGYDYVLVETVGVGQAEWKVHEMTDAFLLLSQPASGDDLQGIKRGILELADHVVVNKADRLTDAAKQSALELRRGLHLAPARPDGWTVKVSLASGLTGRGLEDIRLRLEDYRTLLVGSGQLLARRQVQGEEWLRERSSQRLLEHFATFYANNDSAVAELRRSLADGGSLRAATEALLTRFLREAASSLPPGE